MMERQLKSLGSAANGGTRTQMNRRSPRASISQSRRPTWWKVCRREALNKLPSFLLDLCINPRLMFPAPGETAITSSEAERVLEEFPGMLSSESAALGLPVSAT